MEAFGQPGKCTCYLSEFPHVHTDPGPGFPPAPLTEREVISRAAQDVADAYSLARAFPHCRAYWADYARASAEFERLNPILG
jgi:hypothetical protein